VTVLIIPGEPLHGETTFDPYNRTPQAALGNLSPHDLVYGPPLPAADVDVSVTTKDKDLSRGMGHLLRNPNRLRPPISSATAPNLGPSVLSSPDLTVTSSCRGSLASATSPSSTFPSSDRVLRTRTKHLVFSSGIVPAPTAKRPVKDRWFYAPVPLDAAPTVLAALPHLPDISAVPTVSRPPLLPWATWMLADDDRTDSQADADWHQACDHLFGPSPDDSVARPIPDCLQPPCFCSGEFIDGEVPDGTAPPSLMGRFPMALPPLPQLRSSHFLWYRPLVLMMSLMMQTFSTIGTGTMTSMKQQSSQ
jgi:hypothetical protein